MMTLYHSAMMCSLGLVNKFHFIEFYLKILNGLFLCCHEQMKKHLEAPSRSSNFVQPKENKAEFRSCHSGKESLFCALMYEDTCQKKKEETNFLKKESAFSAN